MSKVSMDIAEEKNLIKKIRKGGKRREESWEKIYRHYRPHIDKFFSFRIASGPDTDDLTSKVFSKALDGIENFKWQGVSLSAWIYAIARNTLIDHYRRENKSRTIPLDKVAEPPAFRQGPAETAQVTFQNDRLWECLRELAPREQKIIYLKFFEGYTNRTISKLTGLSETNVGTIVYRTIRSLREKM